jgi:hypothetical protein
MGLPQFEIVAISRSAAMLSPGQSLPVEREQLISLCEEVLECRRLLARLGSDLRTVAGHGRRPDGQ